MRGLRRGSGRASGHGGGVFDVAEAVTGEQRRRAKAINFGLIYGMSAFGLARQLGLERGEAQGYIDRYFERYPGKACMDAPGPSGEPGIRDPLWATPPAEIRVQNQQRRQAAERTAINAPFLGHGGGHHRTASRWIFAPWSSGCCA